MQHFFTTALHIFVIAAIASFIIGGISALTGSYDHWSTRYVLKARRSRLIRQNSKDSVKNVGVETAMVPFKYYKLNKNTVFYNRLAA